MKTKIKRSLLVLFLATTGIQSYAQVKVGTNPTTINTNSILELESTNKGLLISRLALSATNNVAPLTAHVAGMLVYNTATAGTAPNNVEPGYYINNGSQWARVSSSANLALPQTALTNTTTPAGTTSGQLAYNTSSAGGVPVGPVFWNGSLWEPVSSHLDPWFDAATNKGATSITQTIYHNGNVGIGTTAPTQKLHVADGNLAIGSATTPSTWTTNGSDIFLNTGAASSQVFIRPNGAGSAVSQYRNTVANGHDFFDAAGTSVTMRLTAAGDVGIGTTSPSNKLTVTSNNTTTNGNATLRLNNNTAKLIFEPRSANSSAFNPLVLAGDARMIFDTDGDAAVDHATNGLFIGPWTSTGTNSGLKIVENGNVGIGTTAPATKLNITVPTGTFGRVLINSGTAATDRVDFMASAGGAGIQLGANGSSPNQWSGFTGSSGYGYISFQGDGLGIGQASSIGIPSLYLKGFGANAKFGIGTIAPETKLDVKGSVVVDAESTTGGGVDGIFFRAGILNKYNASILTYDHSGNGTSAADGLSINGWDGVSFSTGDNVRNERMRINQAGNVGIGTTTPATTLTLSGILSATPQNNSTTGTTINSSVVNTSTNMVLPNADTMPGAIIFVRNSNLSSTIIISVSVGSMGINSIIRASSGSQLSFITMDGQSSTSASKALFFVSNGFYWVAMGSAF